MSKYPKNPFSLLNPSTFVHYQDLIVYHVNVEMKQETKTTNDNASQPKSDNSYETVRTEENEEEYYKSDLDESEIEEAIASFQKQKEEEFDDIIYERLMSGRQGAELRNVREFRKRSLSEGSHPMKC